MPLPEPGPGEQYPDLKDVPTSASSSSYDFLARLRKSHVFSNGERSSVKEFCADSALYRLREHVLAQEQAAEQHQAQNGAVAEADAAEAPPPPCEPQKPSREDPSRDGAATGAASDASQHTAAQDVQSPRANAAVGSTTVAETSDDVPQPDSVAAQAPAPSAAAATAPLLHREHSALQRKHLTPQQDPCGPAAAKPAQAAKPVQPRKQARQRASAGEPEPAGAATKRRRSAAEPGVVLPQPGTATQPSQLTPKQKELHKQLRELKPVLMEQLGWDAAKFDATAMALARNTRGNSAPLERCSTSSVLSLESSVSAACCAHKLQAFGDVQICAWSSTKACLQCMPVLCSCKIQPFI